MGQDAGGDGLGPVERLFGKGATIFREGDASQDLYVLLTGAVRVVKGDRAVATIDEPGSYFGEMSSLLGVPRTATVMAADESRLLQVPPDHIASFFGDTPQLALKIARDLAARLAKTTAELAESVASGEEETTG